MLPLKATPFEFLTELKVWGGKKPIFIYGVHYGESQLQSISNSLAVTYAVLYMDFLHKNKQSTVSWWNSWNLWLPEWPIPWLEQEPAPEGREEQTKMQLCLGEGVGEKSSHHVKQLALPFLFYTCCRGATASHHPSNINIPCLLEGEGTREMLQNNWN